MIKLLSINLLPYREIERQEQKKKFNQLLLLVAVVALGVALLIGSTLAQMVNVQRDRNNLLNTEIAKLDEQIKQVETLKARKQEFIARKQKIEELQNERYKAAMILNDLNTVMPEGVYLSQLQSMDGKSYVLTGSAVSDNKVAGLMNSLPSTGLFTAPELVSIRTKDGAQEFILKTTLAQTAPAGGQQAQ